MKSLLHSTMFIYSVVAVMCLVEVFFSGLCSKTHGFLLILLPLLLFLDR